MSCDGLTDRAMSLEEALAGTAAPPSVMVHLCLIEVPFLGFDGVHRLGQLVVHEAVRQELLDLFAWMEKIGFPLGRVVPIVRYGWSDERSMADNNTSAFNYRFVAGTERLSAHALGLAVDINPLKNPVIYADGRISPPGACYKPGAEGVLTQASPVVREFLKRGWQWGGLFTSFKDYHHFEFRIPGPA